MAELAKKSRTVAKTKFTKAKNSLLDAVNKGTTLITIRSRYVKFKIAWDEVQLCHERVVETVPDGEDEVKWLDGVSENYDDTEIFVDEHIEKMESHIRLRERQEQNEEQEELRERRRRSEGRR